MQLDPPVCAAARLVFGVGFVLTAAYPSSEEPPTASNEPRSTHKKPPSVSRSQKRIRLMTHISSRAGHDSAP